MISEDENNELDPSDTDSTTDDAMTIDYVSIQLEFACSLPHLKNKEKSENHDNDNACTVEEKVVSITDDGEEYETTSPPSVEGEDAIFHVKDGEVEVESKLLGEESFMEVIEEMRTYFQGLIKIVVGIYKLNMSCLICICRENINTNIY